MSAQAPQVLSRRTNGVPPPGAAHPTNDSPNSAKIGAESGATASSARGKGTSDRGSEAKSVNDLIKDSPKAQRTKAPNEGEKLVLRRLPPGMTQDEFVSILGQEWELGKGKVDWLYYARGKVSNDPSKPTRPGRAYIHLVRKEYILPLSEVVRAAAWEDAKNTYTSASLIGPPSLEFAAYKKVPGNKRRTDARQGTIDQDPEFMAFLEGLANPSPTKEGPEHDHDGDEGGKSEITTTPLIEYLKEKKANKIKEAAAAKSAKHARQETSSKGKASGKDGDGPSKKGKEKEAKGSKSDRAAPKDVKILTKKAALEQAAESAKNVASQIHGSGAAASATTRGTTAAASAGASASASTEAPSRNRRAGIAQAARILQRDLGLSPGSAHRRARQDAAKADADKTTTAAKDAVPSAQARESSQPQAAAPSESAAKAQASAASAASKAQPSTRRSRGSGVRNGEKAKNAEAASAETLAPTAPMILKKKPTSETADAPKATAGVAMANAPANHPPKTAAASSKSNANASSSGSKSATSQPQKPAAPAKKNGSAPSAITARGFVKHVNASHGISEAALRQALEEFGATTSLEVDKRKGFAYVDFAEHGSLAKAISASPITIAQGAVHVLERKDKKPPSAAPAAGSGNLAPPAEKGTSRGRRGRGGGANKNPPAAANTQADASLANGPG